MATVDHLFENTIILQSTIGSISCTILLFHIFRFKFLAHNTLCDTWTSAVFVLSVFTEQISHVLFDLAQLYVSKLLQSQSKKIKLSIKLKKKKTVKVTEFSVGFLWSERSSSYRDNEGNVAFLKKDPLLSTARKI